MIIAKAPVRLTFAGGGTDIKSYYKRDGGFLIAAGIDKYSTVIVNKGYYDGIHLKYSREERVRDVEVIQHPIFKETIKYLYGLDLEIPPLEIMSLADFPMGCGLGSSGSFTVALVKALEEFKKGGHSFLFPRDIAEIACHIEINILKEPIGKQDQYAAAFGGVRSYAFNTRGEVSETKLNIPNLNLLSNRLTLFDTQIPRRSSDVLTNQVKEMEAGGEVILKLDKAKEMAHTTQELLEHSKWEDWGLLLDDYWQLRKSFSSKISHPLIDDAYATALKNGAVGGKLQGAGGGGFLMFYTPVNQRENLIDAMTKLGLKHMPFQFDEGGVRSWVV